MGMGKVEKWVENEERQNNGEKWKKVDYLKTERREKGRVKWKHEEEK